MFRDIRIVIGGLIVTGLGLIGAAGYFGFASARQDTPETIQTPVTIPVERGDLDLTVTAPGTLVDASLQTIRSATDGQLAAVMVKAGSEVQTGDVLAELEREPLEDALTQAQRSVDQAEEGLAASVWAARDSLRLAQDRLTELQLQYPNRDRAEIDLAYAQTALADARAAAQRADDQVSAAQHDRDGAQADLNTANADLHSANQDAADAQQALTQALADQAAAQSVYDNAVIDQAAAQIAYDDAVANNEPQTVIDQLADVLDAANNAVIDAQIMLTAANDAVIDAQQTYDAANEISQSASAAQLQAQALFDQADGQYEQRKAQADQADASVHAAEYSVQVAQLALDEIPTQQALADLQIDQAERAIGQAENALAYAQSRGVDPDLLKAVEAAEQALDGATIRAEADGVVGEVLREAGEFVLDGDAILTMTVPGRLEVSATVIEEDLPLVEPGQPVTLFFDAAPDADISGVVDRIVPERIPNSDRPLYTVTIRIAQTLPVGLRSGMTVDGSIIIDSREDVLTLPRSVVSARSDGTATLEVWNGTSIEERDVTVGLRGDVYVEILSGLIEGEEVVAQ